MFAHLIEPVSGRAALDPATIADVLARLEELVGRPLDDHPPDNPPKVLKLLREGADRLGTEWSQKLAELSVHLIEAPAYRLAGAEEQTHQQQQEEAVEQQRHLDREAG